MIRICYASLLCLFLFACQAQHPPVSDKGSDAAAEGPSFRLAAERLDAYLPALKGKRVALTVNQTSTVRHTHLVDTLLALGVDIRRIFAPEHGFRGEADAGAHVANGKDTATGLPIVSLYGKNKKPSAAQLADIDVVLFDIQDVGARFYTYISTMHYLMEACAEQDRLLMVLDRPNPNGAYVDGPIREEAQASFVGMHPIPLLHGLTVGELALMINGEKWLPNNAQCRLEVVSCIGYRHDMPYELPVRPSPNLPNARSIALYPSLCLFEGTHVSVGRGTDQQFQIIGSPDYPVKDFSFTPVPKPGAKYPKHEQVACYGKDLSDSTAYGKGLFLTELIHFYQNCPDKANFFLPFFTKLAGTDALQQQIEAGMTAQEIRASWNDGLTIYKAVRKQYLLYD